MNSYTHTHSKSCSVSVIRIREMKNVKCCGNAWTANVWPYLARDSYRVICVFLRLFRARTYEWSDWVNRLRARLIIGNELSGTKAFSPEGVRQKTHSFAFITHEKGQGDVQIHISDVYALLAQCFVVYPSICVWDWVLFCLPMGLGEIQERKWKLLPNYRNRNSHNQNLIENITQLVELFVNLW